MNINIKDIDINYIEKGEGENTILLLHGWGSNITLFNSIIESVSKNQKVYALDMPGFGGSSEPKVSWNVDDYLEFVIEFVKIMNIKKISVLGHSFGGRVIIKMANRKDLPFELDKIILVDSAGILPKKTTKQTYKVKIYKILKNILNNFIVKKIFPNALNKLKSKMGSEDYRNASIVMRETLVKVVNEDLEYLLSTIKQPTLIIWGENDIATPISDAKIMEKSIPNAGLVTIKNAGHYSFLEQPILVNKVLDSFLVDKE